MIKIPQIVIFNSQKKKFTNHIYFINKEPRFGNHYFYSVNENHLYITLLEWIHFLIQNYTFRKGNTSGIRHSIKIEKFHRYYRKEYGRVGMLSSVWWYLAMCNINGVKHTQMTNSISATLNHVFGRSCYTLLITPTRYSFP